MSFVYPMGLLGLIGIPILIIIYIIINRYTEQTVASTYLWTLSNRFLKKRIRISMIGGIISLILQIIAITMISLAIAHPIIVIPASANAYCFVLDGSGSMMITQSGKTRFDVAKGSIEDVIDGAMNGSTYTLVFSGDSPQTIYSGITDKDRAIKLLNGLTCSHNSKPIENALNLAQRYFDENPSTITYVATDKTYTVTENIKLINVYTDVENYSVANVDYTFSSGILDITGSLVAHERASDLTIELYLDDASEPYAKQTFFVDDFEEVPFNFECEIADFQWFKLSIPEKDALMLDNEIVVYNVRYENISKTLLVTDTPLLLRAALVAAGDSQLDVIKTEDYKFTTGYALYIFEDFVPDSLPTDGAVWFVNPNRTLQGTNFNFQGVVNSRQMAKYSTSTSLFIRGMFQGVTKNDFSLVKYAKCGINGRFTTLISCEGNPILFVGANAYGYREVVFAFNLRDSAMFSLTSDFTTLVGHLLSYSFPSIIEETNYDSGEIMQINVISGCDSIIVTSPTGKNSYLDTITDVVEYELTEVGVYTVTAVMRNQADRECKLFASMPKAERTPFIQEESIVLLGKQEHNKTNGLFDTLLTIFIILAVVAVADYGVYCYEQYQLR
ncbi:MAG: VWA domain-containing protein [Clostridiales bacterium]|nr:VWA domain-containing protein [Clostridiales bacterium]